MSVAKLQILHANHSRRFATFSRRVSSERVTQRLTRATTDHAALLDESGFWEHINRALRMQQHIGLKNRHGQCESWR